MEWRCSPRCRCSSWPPERMSRPPDYLSARDGYATSPDFQERSAYAAAKAFALRQKGANADALRWAEQALEAMAILGAVSESVKNGFGEAVEAALALGDLDKADELIRRIEDLKVGAQPPFLRAQAARFRARLSELEGKSDGVEQQFKTAEQIFREYGIPFWLALDAARARRVAQRARARPPRPSGSPRRPVLSFERLEATPVDRTVPSAARRTVMSGVNCPSLWLRRPAPGGSSASSAAARSRSSALPAAAAERARQQVLLASAVRLSASPPASPRRTAPAAERRLVSVLFADLVGFTTLSESRDSEEVRELLTAYFDRCKRLIERYGGTVEKFIGDAVMAVWGTPVAMEDDAERAVRAALELVAAVADLDPALRARAGVLTGEAAVTLGAEGQGMVAGDLVNTAVARPVRGRARNGARRRGDEACDRGGDRLRGRGHARPEGQGRADAALPGAARDRGPRGRAALVEPRAAVRRPRPRAPPGQGALPRDRGRAAGPARLGRRRRRSRQVPHLLGVREVPGRAGRRGMVASRPLPLLRRGGRILGARGDGADALRDRRGRGGRTLRSPSCARRSSSTSPTRRSVPGSSPASPTCSASRRASPATRRTCSPPGGSCSSASRRSIRSCSSSRTCSGPTPGCSTSSTTCSTGRGTTRSSCSRSPGRSWPRSTRRGAPGSARSPRSTSSRCRARRWRALLAGLVPGLPEELRNQILERAEGIPLYAVETVRMLLDRGLLAHDGTAFRPTGPIETLEVPETLHALVAARLDGLAAEERRLVQGASVLGKTFTQAGHRRGHRARRRGARRRCSRRSLRKEVLSIQADPRSPERGQYSFLQDIVKHVAYETLSKRERKDKHLAAARYLATRLGRGGGRDRRGRRCALPRRLARRARRPTTQTRSRRTAREMLVRAAERASSLGATAEAQRAYERAIELTDDAVVQAELHERAGIEAVAGARADEAIGHYEDCDRALRERRAAHPAARVSARRAEIMWERGKLAEASREPGAARSRCSREDEPDEALATLAAQLGRFTFFAGEFDVARAADRDRARSRRGAPAAGGPLAGAEHEGRDACTRAAGGRRRPSSFATRSRSPSRQDKPSAALRAYNNVADILVQGDRYEEADQMLVEGIAYARKVGNRQWERSAARQIYAAFALGKWDGVLEHAAGAARRSSSPTRGSGSRR